MDPGQLIRDVRLRAGLTQAELAERCGTSQATLSAYEAGAKTPSASTLARVLAAGGQRLTAVRAERAVRSPGTAVLARRARTLRQVLELAEMLPTRHSPDLRYPRLAPGR